jgi:D-3-phosphoglycerate dehydrogenase
MSKPTLLVLNGTCLDVVDAHREWVASQGIELIAKDFFRAATEDEILDAMKGADAVILPASVRDMPRAGHMAACPKLRVCAIAASGFEWLDVEAATREGIVVTFAPGGAGAEVVAEMATGLMLAVARQIPFHHQKICNGDASRGMSTSVFGKTLGIVGLGAIGRELVTRAQGLKLRVIASDPQPNRQFAADHRVELVSLDELLRRSDFVSLHVRLSDQTRNMIGRRELALMKPTAFLINTARQELVDEQAIVEAIVSKKIAGAALDDPPRSAEKKLLGLDNVVFTPHLGNRSIEGVNAVFRAALEGAIAVLQGQRPAMLVNPKVYERGLRNAK